MVSLPRATVVPGKVFETTGVDYIGLIQLLGKRGRHKLVLQAYIAIFV